jgi:hypothetical protein
LISASRRCDIAAILKEWHIDIGLLFNKDVWCCDFGISAQNYSLSHVEWSLYGYQLLNFFKQPNMQADLYMLNRVNVYTVLYPFETCTIHLQSLPLNVTIETLDCIVKPP